MVPLKTDKAEPPEGAGAGGGKECELLLSVGLNVPVTNGVPNELLAASSSVRVMFVTGWLPPTSDMITAFCPAGPTNNISMSAGNVWDRFLSLTVTFVTTPHRPETAMLDG